MTQRIKLDYTQFPAVEAKLHHNCTTSMHDLEEMEEKPKHSYSYSLSIST